MKIFFTSNMYFGKESAAKARGFDSIEDMDEALIGKWNAKVSDNDIVYHLGNFAWDPLSAEMAMTRLNGVINFMVGEWDKALYEVIERFEEHVIISGGIFPIDSYDLILSYWPLLDWPGREYKVIHIFGGDKYKTRVNKSEIKVNCNCDNWSLEPIELETIKGLKEMFTKE